MKQRIINYGMVLILTGCLVMPVWAGQAAPPPAPQQEYPADTVNRQADLHVVTAKLGFKSQGRWFPGQVVNLDLFGYNFQDVQKFRMDVKYDPQQLRLVSVSRGTFLVEDQGFSQWNSGVSDGQKGLVANIAGIRYQSFSGNETTLLRLNFIVDAAGSGQVSLENVRLVSVNGIERAFDFTPLEYRIGLE